MLQAGRPICHHRFLRPSCEEQGTVVIAIRRCLSGRRMRPTVVLVVRVLRRGPTVHRPRGHGSEIKGSEIKGI
ncbi:hypothetical protein EYF80_052291 [Liparis tanakae]|uniref:Uncharacterized protein n=1 Tax=Liparis tanakae TaxID=230148 RepID=A0A4Z2FAY3_9TELE|nr:hypothetical protein EYF80_052291 [Liparis tanakae]